MNLPALPIVEVLDELIGALTRGGKAILQAPPGAGKTTLVPLAMLKQVPAGGRIIMLEPRRLAARTAAERMAHILGEKVGQTVGYRVRGEVKTSRRTRIEVVTEAILTRMIQSDQTLAGIGAVIFDEFHERGLPGDLGLALSWEVRAVLRPDLWVLVMSATLDAAPLAAMLEAPVIRSQGRMFPVEMRWLARPLAKSTRFEAAAADLVVQAAQEKSGGLLVFLPGEGEIRRVQALLKGRLPEDCEIQPLFGAMPFAAQRAAIAPGGGARKVVLATAIAETSLTIADISVVVDCGRARRARFDPGSGMSRLVTGRLSKAEAEQRAGRAGRTASGSCWRMWTRGEHAGLAAFAPAEIEIGDLSGLCLELALWGANTGDGLAFLTPPAVAAMAAARSLLRELDALDGVDRITAHGRALAALPLHPRLGHMLIHGGSHAAHLAALLADRDPLRGVSGDLLERQRALEGDHPQARHGDVQRIRAEARRLARLAPKRRERLSWGALAALAYPDRVGLRRPGTAARWKLSGGKGAWMHEADPMANAQLIVAVDLDGDAREAKIRLAVEISEAELRAIHAERIIWHNSCEWSAREGRVLARRQERFGALVLDDRVWRTAPAELLAAAALDGVRTLGLPWSKPAQAFRDRVMMARANGADLPDMQDAALMTGLAGWLAPYLAGVRSAADIAVIDLQGALRAMLDHQQLQVLERSAPAFFITPMGRRAALDYAGDTPQLSVRVQEMFGLNVHPVVAGRALRITLLSPAGRPVQTTLDLAGFWATSYAQVRKEMRGRYPKHPWPEDPTRAAPTLRARPRKR